MESDDGGEGRGEGWRGLGKGHGPRMEERVGRRRKGHVHVWEVKEEGLTLGLL